MLSSANQNHKKILGEDNQIYDHTVAEQSRRVICFFAWSRLMPMAVAHCLNKNRQDIINRFQLLQGRRVGMCLVGIVTALPIELKSSKHEAKRSRFLRP